MADVVGGENQLSATPEKINACVPITPEKAATMRRAWTVFPPSNSKLASHKSTLLREIFQNENLSKCETFSEQCYHLFHFASAHESAGPDWVFSFGDHGSFWGETRQYIRKMIETWKRVDRGEELKFVGRPFALKSIDEERIHNFVKESDEKLYPLTQTALLKWINLTFNTQLSVGWINNYLQRENRVYLVDGEPLEVARAEIRDDALKENAANLLIKVNCVNVDLIFNFDETALDCKLDTQSLKIVSARQCPRSYATIRPDSHITFAPTVGVTGWTLPILIIIKTISVISDIRSVMDFRNRRGLTLRPRQPHTSIVRSFRIGSMKFWCLEYKEDVVC